MSMNITERKCSSCPWRGQYRPCLHPKFNNNTKPFSNCPETPGKLPETRAGRMKHLRPITEEKSKPSDVILLVILVTIGFMLGFLNGYISGHHNGYFHGYSNTYQHYQATGQFPGKEWLIYSRGKHFYEAYDIKKMLDDAKEKPYVPAYGER